MGFYRQTPEQERIEYLENKIEDMRSEQERARHEAYERENERREARRREFEEAQLYANDWSDGFSKGLGRARAEARAEAADNERMKDDPNMADIPPFYFFRDWVVQLERGRAIFEEESQAAQRKIERLEALIAKVHESVRLKTADRLEAEDGDESLVEALREDNPTYLTNW